MAGSTFNGRILVNNSTSNNWKRPSDWLPIPAIAGGEEVIYWLFFVSQNSGANYMLTKHAGDYTVDWGDGDVTNYTSGSTAQKQYDFSSISASTEITFEGITYRQVIIKVTPQGGNNLTLCDWSLTPSGFFSTTWRYTGVMEWHHSTPNLSNASASQLVKQGGRWSNCRIINMATIGASPRAEHSSGLFSTFPNVRQISINNNSGWLDCSNLFLDDYNLQTITALQPFTSATTFSAAHRTNTQLKDFSYYNAPANTSLANFVQNCYGLNSLELDIPSVTTCNLVVSGLLSLKELILTNCANVTTFGTSFVNTQLEKVILQGATVGFSVRFGYLGATELDAMFTALGTASGSQTIDVRSNPGSTTCDPTIATAKGFTVTTV